MTYRPRYLDAAIAQGWLCAVCQCSISRDGPTWPETEPRYPSTLDIGSHRYAACAPCQSRVAGYLGHGATPEHALMRAKLETWP